MAGADVRAAMYLVDVRNRICDIRLLMSTLSEPTITADDLVRLKDYVRQVDTLVEQAIDTLQEARA